MDALEDYIAISYPFDGNNNGRIDILNTKNLKNEATIMGKA